MLETVMNDFRQKFHPNTIKNIRVIKKNKITARCLSIQKP